MSTRTATQTTTITAGDVRQVMALTTEEIGAICEGASRVARDFDKDGALIDCSLLALNDVISAIRLQFYVGDELVREYAYVIADEPLESSGPPAGQPPLGSFPENARVRLTTTPNPCVAKDVADGWFRRLGWTTAEPLRRPGGIQPDTYGTFVSGAYGVERKLLVNPKFDQSSSRPEKPWMKKEG